MNDSIEVVELNDEEGIKRRFEHLLTYDYMDNRYIALTPYEEDNDSEELEIIILKVVEQDNGEDIYVSISDDELIDEVFDVFEQIYNEISE